MIKKKLILFLMTISCVLYSIPSFSIEKELLGVRLGSDYESTKKTLIGKYGEPYKSVQANQIYDIFIRDKKSTNNIIIGTSNKYLQNITWIQVSGDKPIPDLDFIGGINLGEKEKSIELLLSKPTKIGNSSHGYKQYRFDYSNYSIESKDGFISSIKIDLSNAYSKGQKDRTDLIVLSANEAKYLREENDPYLYSIDKLKKHCKCRYPIRNHNGVYYIDVNVFGPNGFHPFTFLLDTGWSDNAISKNVCSKIGCKKITKEAAGLKRQKVTGGFIGIGSEVFRFDEFFLEDREWLDKMGVDGVIGSGVLFSKGIFLNLKNEYLCFPKKDIKEVAEDLNFLKVNAMYDAGRIWVDFFVNNKHVKDYFIDTGASLSSLLTDDIERLKLNYISQEEHYYAASGLITSKTFGPVIIGWPQVSRKLEYVYESKTPEYRKIGNDFLGGTILGIDALSNNIYISE